MRFDRKRRLDPEDIRACEACELGRKCEDHKETNIRIDWLLLLWMAAIVALLVYSVYTTFFTD